RVGAVGGVGAGRQDVPEVRGDADVGEERVESQAGEDLDPAAHVQDFSHGRVGRGDDGAGGGAAAGVPAGQLRHLHVLGAGGVDREGEAPGDVLDEITVEVELELVEGPGIPPVFVVIVEEWCELGVILRRGIHPDYRARAVVVAGPGEAHDVGDVFVRR